MAYNKKRLKKVGDHYIGLKVTQSEKETLVRIAEKEYRHITGQLRYMIANWENLVDRAKYKDM